MAKDILNQSIFVLLHPDDLPDFLGVFGKVLQTEHSQYYGLIVFAAKTPDIVSLSDLPLH